MNQTNIIRILIVDDHAIVQQGLIAIIDEESDMTVVGQAQNGIEAIELFRKEQPDVTLMDLRMPEMGGVEAIMALCTEFNTARIIVLTTYDGDEDIYRGLRAGAKGYLLKDSKPSELRSAIRTVHVGQQYIPPHVGAKLVQRMNNPELTDRELEVLLLVAQGMSNLEISVALTITESTVKSFVNRILSKLGAKDRTQATIIALRRGLTTV
ncbi:MAG: response regulator transcription factor [Nostoc sp. DedQUE12b]|uniref:response regulator transcription factor n=1 Tax=Nostoc sp. DedQUE12b TaxID=3075398 RepID=UPI002AD2B287|nr:response regulator transcription factor [Nostoc sp. DedQUE12b]MDZ8088756.1 response regulator transcription factor [Nostoc sp. DedQUE12b]